MHLQVQGNPPVHGFDGAPNEAGVSILKVGLTRNVLNTLSLWDWSSRSRFSFEQGKGDCKILENKGREPFLPPVFPGVPRMESGSCGAEIPDLLGRERVGAFFRIEK
ncbi:hypothetical protein DPMN_015069 [Dreissena polymorpha]|uniref:Uncharacterized protein n=1 Tax=Dreissena polymorpha TaxID=45954 RepID=A0A9D4NAJ1_DREPO|nr:hypothetical protein DPMN_015069 [Dreissena polymorpha]